MCCLFPSYNRLKREEKIGDTKKKKTGKKRKYLKVTQVYLENESLD